MQGKKLIAVPASQLPWNMSVVKPSARGDGVFAEEPEIKIHGVFHYSSAITDNYVYADNFTGIGLPGLIKRKTQKRFDNTQFVHKFRGDAIIAVSPRCCPVSSMGIDP